jgi:hypothetical protein
MTMEQPNTADPIPIKDASRENTPFNKIYVVDIGYVYRKYTVLDEIHSSTGTGSAARTRPTRTGCGPYYSNDAIEQGDYKNGVRQSYLPAAPPSLIGEGDGGGDAEKNQSPCMPETTFSRVFRVFR